MACDYWSNDSNGPCGKCVPCETTEALRARIEELETVNPELIPQHLLNEARADIVKLKTEVESKSSAADWWCERANETVEERDKEKALVFKLTGELEERSKGVLVRDVAAFINDKYEGALRRIMAKGGVQGGIAKAAMDFSTFIGEGIPEESGDSLKLRIVALGSLVMSYRVEHNSRCDSVTTSSAIVPSEDGQCPCPICMDAIAHYRVCAARDCRQCEIGRD